MMDETIQQLAIVFNKIHEVLLTQVYIDITLNFIIFLACVGFIVFYGVILYKRGIGKIEEEFLIDLGLFVGAGFAIFAIIGAYLSFHNGITGIINPEYAAMKLAKGLLK